MIQVTLKGNTFGIKETLKGLGFKWAGAHNCWVKNFNDDQEDEAIQITRRWYSEGVYGSILKIKEEK